MIKAVLDTNVLVTGAKRLQLVDAFRGVCILSPRAFLDLLEKSGAE